MSIPELIVLALAFFCVAALYSSVGHAGASGYLAIMALIGMAPVTMRPTALALNLVVATLATWRFWRAGWTKWSSLWPLIATSVPLAFIGGRVHLPVSGYRALLGFVLVSSALVLAWRAWGGERHLGEPPPRIPLLVALGAGALIGALFVALVTVVVVPVLLNYVQFGTFEAWLTKVLPWAAMFLLVVTCLSILYRFGPNVPGGFRSPWISVGVLVAAAAWAGVSIGFSVYLANFNSYNAIYGSIGAVIILMMWLYLSVWSILLGGAINAELDARLRDHWPLRQRAVLPPTENGQD
jgi:uncharacterized membrane protein YfcA